MVESDTENLKLEAIKRLVSVRVEREGGVCQPSHHCVRVCVCVHLCTCACMRVCVLLVCVYACVMSGMEEVTK